MFSLNDEPIEGCSHKFDSLADRTKWPTIEHIVNTEGCRGSPWSLLKALSVSLTDSNEPWEQKVKNRCCETSCKVFQEETNGWKPFLFVVLITEH